MSRLFAWILLVVSGVAALEVVAGLEVAGGRVRAALGLESQPTDQAGWGDLGGVDPTRGDPIGVDPIGSVDLEEVVAELGDTGWAFGALRDGGVSAVEAARLVESFHRLVEDPTARIRVLGSTNDALYSPLGRDFVRTTLRALREQSGEERGKGLQTLLRTLSAGSDEGFDEEARATLRALCDAFEPRWSTVQPRTVRVRPQDTLSGIAARMRRETGEPVTTRALQLANGLRDPNRIRAGQDLVVPSEPWVLELRVGHGLLLVEKGRTLLWALPVRVRTAGPDLAGSPLRLGRGGRDGVQDDGQPGGGLWFGDEAGRTGVLQLTEPGALGRRPAGEATWGVLVDPAKLEELGSQLRPGTTLRVVP